MVAIRDGIGLIVFDNFVGILGFFFFVAFVAAFATTSSSFLTVFLLLSLSFLFHVGELPLLLFSPLLL